MASIKANLKEFLKLEAEKPKIDEPKSKVGSCLEMCPKAEINFRTKNLLIHPMESSSPFVSMKRSEREPVLGKMVKEYSRPAADKKVDLKDVRPYETLMITTQYLLGYIFAVAGFSYATLIIFFIASIKKGLIVYRP